MAGETILSGSVGAGGANQPPDVGLVQILLNVMRGMQSKTLLSVDGICGPLTTAAIREFQADFAPKTDGLVDQRGATLRLLVYSYVTILRLGVYDLGRFPPSWGQLAFQERPSPRDLGAVLRVAFNDLRRGITPLLKAAPRPPSGPSRPDTRDPDRPGRLEEQV